MEKRRIFLGKRGVGEENRTKHRNGRTECFFKHISPYGINPFFYRLEKYF